MRAKTVETMRNDRKEIISDYCLISSQRCRDASFSSHCRPLHLREWIWTCEILRLVWKNLHPNGIDSPLWGSWSMKCGRVSYGNKDCRVYIFVREEIERGVRLCDRKESRCFYKWSPLENPVSDPSKVASSRKPNQAQEEKEPLLSSFITRKELRMNFNADRRDDFPLASDPREGFGSKGSRVRSKQRLREVVTHDNALIYARLNNLFQEQVSPTSAVKNLQPQPHIFRTLILPT